MWIRTNDPLLKRPFPEGVKIQCACGSLLRGEEVLLSLSLSRTLLTGFHGFSSQYRYKNRYIQSLRTGTVGRHLVDRSSRLTSTSSLWKHRRGA